MVLFLADDALAVDRFVVLFAAALLRAGADRVTVFLAGAFFAVAFFTAGARRSGVL